MEKNVGGTDRSVRIVVGILFALVSMAVLGFGGDLGTTVQGLLGGGALVLAAIFLATAGSQKCLLNTALGRNTYHPPDVE